MAHKNDNWVEGSFHNVTLHSSVNEITAVLGEPVTTSGESKTRFDWNAITESGIEFTVYDWKEGSSFDNNEIIQFHIGGKDRLSCMTAKSELYKDILKNRI